MKIFISGDPHINIGKWDHTTGKMCARRTAVTRVFKEGLELASQEICDYYMHTGDFLDGPLRQPNLSSNEYYLLDNRLEEALNSGLEIHRCPVGNHDIPKSRYTNHRTVWRNLTCGSEADTRNVLILDFCPDGQEAAEKQFYKAVDNWATDLKEPWLVVAHHLFEGNYEFNMNSEPTHENWFQKDWLAHLKEKVGPDGMVVLGHDHKPWADYSKEIPVINIGSPTPMAVNDTDPRRFMIWEDGEITFFPVESGLKDYKITLDSEVPEGTDRVILDMVIETDEDELKLKEKLRGLREKGIEVVNKTSLFRDDVNQVDLATTFNIQSAYKKFVKENGISSDISEIGMDILVETGVCN